jgi:hydroxyacylglutathione hydrolase
MKIERYPNGPLDVNTYLVYSEDTGFAVVIDPSYEVKSVIDRVGEKGLQVEYIINTHSHIDHIAGNKIMHDKVGARIVSHTLARKHIENPSPSMINALPPIDDSPPVDIVVEDGELINVNDFQLIVVFTPGHCPGHICLKSDNALFVGDLLFAGSIGRTDFPNCNSHHMSDSLMRIWSSIPDSFEIFPGHGPPTKHSIEKESNYLYKRMTGNI